MTATELDLAVDEVLGPLGGLGEHLGGLGVVDATVLDGSVETLLGTGDDGIDDVGAVDALCLGQFGDRRAVPERLSHLAALEAKDLGDLAGATRTALAEALTELATVGAGVLEGLDDGVALRLGEGSVVDENLEGFADSCPVFGSGLLGLDGVVLGASSEAHLEANLGAAARAAAGETLPDDVLDAIEAGFEMCAGVQPPYSRGHSRL